jgi:hypothetical protein
MKKLFLAFSIATYTTAGHAQDCNGFLYMTNNAEVQMTIYDKKGKESGIQTWKISDVKKNGSGYQSTINSSFTDVKGKEIAKGVGTYKCDNGLLQADVRMALPQQEQFQTSADASLENAFLEYPNSMTVGQSLKDADFSMDMKMNTGMNAKVDFKQMNRKVLNKENITTPAGSWDAYIIGYDANFKMKLGPMGIPMNYTAKEWFVPGVGIVKSETYKNGKLAGYTMITSIKK